MTDKKQKALVVTSLGGLHEQGKNMLVLEAHNQAHPSEYLVLDAGILYPGNEAPGVDYTFADYKYLLNKAESVLGLVLTSAHEGHCGGAHHLITKLNLKKVLGSKLALETVKLNLSQEQIDSITWIEFKSRERISLGRFNIIPFRITSSTAESYTCAFEAEGSKFFYSGSFKIDQTPTDSKKTDLVGMSSYAALAHEESKPIDLYMGDSANVEKSGYSKSELALIPRFRELLKTHSGRVIVNTYNENTLRIQNLFSLAEKTGRKIALLNKDAREACKAATRAGCLIYNESNLISVKETDNYPDNEVLVLATAPEGEALRELEKLAYDKSLELQIKEGDMVINSADLPPGTVRIMAQLADQFFLKKVKILGGPSSELHAESHACCEELKFMFNLLRPKYFVPGMGETRCLARHARLAVEAGQDPGSVLLMDNGNQIYVNQGSLQVNNNIETGDILFNDSRDFHVDNKIVKERDSLALEGVVTVAFSINKKGTVVSGPFFSAKACTFSNNKEWRAFCLMNSPDILDAIHNHAEENPKATLDDYQDLVREHMNRIIRTQIGKKPAVIVLANEI
jgi:ribonuclease J